MTTRLPRAAERALLARLLTEEAAPNAPRRAERHAGARKAPSVPSTTPAPLIVTVEGHGPTVNHMYLTVKGGGRILTDAARAWYDRAIPAIKAGAAGWAVPDGPLKLTIVLYALPRSRDLDNALKSSQDALARALDFNDKQIDMLTVVRGVGKPARTVYTLEAL